MEQAETKAFGLYFIFYKNVPKDSAIAFLIDILKIQFQLSKSKNEGDHWQMSVRSQLIHFVTDFHWR